MTDGKNSKKFVIFVVFSYACYTGDSLQTETAMVEHALSESLK